MKHLVRTLVASGVLAAGVATALSASPGGAAVHATGAVITAHDVSGSSYRIVAPSSALRVGLEFILAPRDEASLQSFVTGVSTPGSATYHHYLARGQYARRFGASSATVTAVRSYLARHGMTGLTTSPDRLFVRGVGSVHVVQQLLHTTISQYRYHGRRVYTNTRRATIPGPLASSVKTVLGLSDVPVAHPHVHVSPSVTRPLTTSCSQMSAGTNATTGPFTIPEVGAAYHYGAFGAHNTFGQGQTVAIYELTDYLPADLRYFQDCTGKQDSITGVQVDGGGGVDLNAEVEAALDIEIVATLAPKANIEVYQGPDVPVGMLDTYQRIALDDTAQVVSTSWGFCETADAPTVTAESAVFTEMAAQGQTVVAASGDAGASDCLLYTGSASNPLAGAIGVDDPASQPYVTGVGGTTITNAATIGTTPSSEVVWDASTSGGGGGVSSIWPRPTYQTGVAGTSSAGRSVPDFSIDADPASGYMVYTTATGWYRVGGTSCGAPMAAALVALTNEYHATQLGFMNPLLYQVAVNHPGEIFNDVTVGNNETYDVAGFASAASGYDAASGWGSPIGSAFLGGDI
jgi:subtilase family serine protease